MQAVIDRDYCLKNPRKIISLFGLDVFLGMLFGNHETLLERVAEKYQARSIAMPGPLGNAYKLSALFEFRVARIYQAMAKRFQRNADACRLFTDLAQEEMEHGRIMLTCLHQITIDPKSDFMPSIRDPQIRSDLDGLRDLERRVVEMSLAEALASARQLEASEVNVIFGRLLKQVGKPQTEIFAEQIAGTQSHPVSVPRRIKALEEKLGPAGMAAAV